MKMLIGGVAIVCACLLVIFGFFAYLLPYCDYLHAIMLAESGEYIKAYEAFLSMGDYKDSQERAEEIFDQYKAEKLEKARVGQTIYFGTYEQDNDLTNGPEDIEWVILAMEDGKALLISQCGLDAEPFHRRDEPVTWADCTLRTWLNSTFLDAAFSQEEQALILTTTVADARNEELTTEDKVYVLSDAELERYLVNLDARRRDATEYAIAQGGFVNRYNDTCWWWTRTTKGTGSTVSTIDAYGAFENFGSRVTDTSVSVAPAMWIQLDK